MNENEQTNGGVTPLMLAVKSGDEQMVARVLNCNGNPFYRDAFGNTAADQIGDGGDNLKTLIEAAKV